MFHVYFLGGEIPPRAQAATDEYIHHLGTQHNGVQVSPQTYHHCLIYSTKINYSTFIPLHSHIITTKNRTWKI